MVAAWQLDARSSSLGVTASESRFKTLTLDDLCKEKITYATHKYLFFKFHHDHRSTMRTCRSLLLSFLCLARLLEPSTAFVSLQRSALISVTKASTASSSSKLNSFGDFKGIAKFFQPDKQDAKPIRPKYETVIIEPDFRVGGLFLAFGGLLDTIPYIQLFVGPFVTLLGVLFVVQGFRVRFIFDNEALELATVGDSKGELKSSGENIVVGKYLYIYVWF